MNKTKLGLIAIITLLLSSGSVFAQNSATGREIKKADVNFTELAKYYQEHPLPLIRKMPFNEDEQENEKPKHRAAHGASVHLIEVSTSGSKTSETPHTAYLPVSPAPNDSFLSTVSPSTLIPPDTHGAVDSQYCVTAINSNIHIQTRTGGNVSNITLDGFWSSVLPSGTGTFDPRVHYDPYNKRWILVTDAVNNGTMAQSTVLIAVSATNDPTGIWHMYAIDVDPTGASWMDFPNVGYNNKWISVTGNMFPNTGAGIGGAIVYFFDYSSIMAGAGAPHTVFYQSNSFAICPALTYDPAEPNLYALETWNGGAGQLQLWEISGAVGSPTMTVVGNPTTTTHWHGGPPGGGDFAPQVGTSNLINIGDDRITSVTYRNHKLWCSHSVFLPRTGTATRSSIMWWQMDTLANPIQNGLIDDPSSATFYAYSSIAVNVNDDALIGFGVFSNTIHPSGGYALHLHTDAVGSTHTPFIYRHGQSTYYETFGGGRNRWGDYSGTCIDPRNDTDFWTIQETSTPAATVNWDTWWANVQFCPKPAAPVLLSTPGTLCVGNAGEYFIDSIPGATSYKWIVTGTGWVGDGSTADSTKLLAGTTVATVTVLAYNACGEGESLTFNLTPGVPPIAAPTITTITHACVGSATAVFSASAPGATSYSWQALGTGWSGTSSSTSLTAVVGTGTGTIICGSSNACGIGPVDTLLVTPATLPVAAFTFANDTTTTGTNDLITFTGTAPPGASYSWTFAGGSATPGSGPGPQTASWSTPGLKILSLTIFNSGCVSNDFIDTVYVRDNTGVQALDHHNLSISIMPNPNDGSFEIMFDKPLSKSLLVKLADMQGRIVYSNEFNGTSNNKVAVSAGNLPSGIYTVSIFIDGVVTTDKVTITR